MRYDQLFPGWVRDFDGIYVLKSAKTNQSGRDAQDEALVGKQSEHGGSKSRLLIEAGKLFAERGYGPVALQEIAEAAGVTKGSFFWHFENKRQVYVEAVQFAVWSAFGHHAPEIKGPSPDVRLHRYLKWVLPAMAGSPVTRRLLLRVVIDHDVDLMRELIKGPLGESYKILTGILKELKPRHDKTALGFFVSAIFALNDEMLAVANVWEPKLRSRVGGGKSIRFFEILIKSW